MIAGLVSVVVTTYNRCGMVVETINSIISQSYGNLEVIVVDDCSIDDTVMTLNREFGDRIRLLKTPKNSGVQTATNIGLAACKGEFICATGDDDIWHPDKVRRCVEVLQQDKIQRYGIVCTSVNFKSNGCLKPAYIKRPKNIVRHLLARNGVIYGSAALFRSELLKVVGNFDEYVTKGTDSAFFRKALLAGYDIYWIADALVDYRIDNTDRMSVLTLKSARSTIAMQSKKLSEYDAYYRHYRSAKSFVFLDMADKYSFIYSKTRSRYCKRLSCLFYVKSISTYPLQNKAYVKLLLLVFNRQWYT